MLKLRRQPEKPPTVNLSAFLRASDVTPVLMDIGAAGTSPEPWKAIATNSTLVGFEPDQRNPDPSFGKGFAKSVMVDKVVVASDDAETATLILTQYPSCSSLLEADLDALSTFVFRDYFKPIDQQTVPATSLNRVFDTYGLSGPHWLKLDSQGIDKQLLSSMAPQHFASVLAVDIEPGFIDAYKGEDLYPECHAWLKDQGFWLAELKQQSYAKMRPESLEELIALGFDKDKVLSCFKKSPTAAEALYFREVGWMAENVADQKLWAGVFAFALSQKFAGYCSDLVFSHRNKFGEGDLNGRMQDALVTFLKATL